MFSLIFFLSLINSTEQNSRVRLISLFEFFSLFFQIAKAFRNSRTSFELVALQLEMQNEKWKSHSKTNAIDTLIIVHIPT